MSSTRSKSPHKASTKPSLRRCAYSAKTTGTKIQIATLRQSWFNVRQPEIEHQVRIRDFENWLDFAGKSPAEMALKSRLRTILDR